MSFEALLTQNKILGYFTLETSANIQKESELQPSTLPLFVFHNHYPIIYYQELYQHFRNCLPEKCEPGNLRIFYNKKELSSDIPLGLYVTESTACFDVGVDQTVTAPDAFRVIKNSWKKAIEVVNFSRRCDYVKNRLSEKDLRKKFKLYCDGMSHGFQHEGLYEGNHMIVKGFWNGEIVERKYAIAEFPTMREIATDLFCLPNMKGTLKITSHNVDVDLTMSSKVFLDEWSYNDGYCYLRLDEIR